MTVRIAKPSLTLRSLLARLVGIETRLNEAPPPPIKFTGDGSTTSFACTRGYKPVLVWKDGVMQREGTGDAYSVAFDGFIHSVVFAVAPANAARVDILQWKSK